MTKVNINVTVDYDVHRAAQATGQNLSQVCEQALANLAGHHKELPSIYSHLCGDEHNEMLNKVVHFISEEPRRAPAWKNIFKGAYGLVVSEAELCQFARELMES